MLKEKIEILNQTEEDVLALSQNKINLKNDYLNLKDKFLKSDYETKLQELDQQINQSVTYLVNQYEEFNNLKSSKDAKIQKEISQEKETILFELKNEIKNETDKNLKQQLKAKYKDTKVLYSKSMKTKIYLMITLLSTIGLILASLLVAYLVKTPHPFEDTNGTIAFSIVMLCLVLTLIGIGYMAFHESKKWVLDRQKSSLWSFIHSIWIKILDSFGIGNYAVYMIIFKKNGIFNDMKKTAPTLNASGTGSALFCGALTLTAVKIDMTTLVLLIVACMIGAFIGSYFVNKVNRKLLTLITGIVLAITVIPMFLSIDYLNIMPKGKDTSLILSDNWYKMIIAFLLFSVFGALLSFGIGIYAPSMVVVALLGMDFTLAAPIMMLSAGFATQINGYVAMKRNNYLPKTAYAMNFGKIVGSIIYYFVVYIGVVTLGHVDMKTLGIVLKIVSVPIVAYASFMLLQSYWKMRKQTPLPKKAKLTQNEFKLTNYLIQEKINYQVENQKLNYHQIKW